MHTFPIFKHKTNSMLDKENLSKLIPDGLKETREALLSKAEESTQQLKDYFSNLGSSLNDGAKEKAIQYSNELIQLAPLIEDVGYRTTGISISIALPPSINFHFENFKEISAEKRNEIIQQHADKELFGVIVKALVTADEFQSKLNLGNFKLGSIDLGIGLPPSVNILLVPKT